MFSVTCLQPWSFNHLSIAVSSAPANPFPRHSGRTAIPRRCPSPSANEAPTVPATCSGEDRYQHVHALQSFSKRGLIEHCVSISFWRITDPIRLKCRRQAPQNPMLIPSFCGTDEKFSQVLHIGMPGQANLVHLIVEDLDYQK